MSLRESISVSLGKKGVEELMLEEATTTHEDRKTSTFSEAQYTDSKPLEYPAGTAVQPFPEPARPHPFNVLIADFQTRRASASHRRQASVFEFLTCLKREMRELDAQYLLKKRMRREAV